VVLTPIKLTRLGPSFFTIHIPRKLNSAPAALYIKVESVPPSNVASTSRKITTLEASFVDSVYSAMHVIILANPNLAPGAKAKGKGIDLSKRLMTTAWADNKAIYACFLFSVKKATRLLRTYNIPILRAIHT